MVLDKVSYIDAVWVFFTLKINRPVSSKSAFERIIKKFESKGTILNNSSCERRRGDPRKDLINDNESFKMCRRQ